MLGLMEEFNRLRNNKIPWQLTTRNFMYLSVDTDLCSHLEREAQATATPATQSPEIKF